MTVIGSGCAQIGMPTGGAKDTIAPVLVKSNPEIDKLNFTGNKITLTFNEYIDVKELQTNLLVSPLPKKNPTISSNLKTVTIRLRDTLKPNTTYSINFGNAIVDINESNPFKNFTYTFSTGNSIDSLKASGRVQMAETGKTDSTLIILLYRDAPDSAVTTTRPDYVTRLNGDGSFTFTHLPGGSFKIYALKDGDGGKYYNAKTEEFAFLDSSITISANTPPVALYAYAEEKAATTSTSSSSAKKAADKKIKYNTSISGMRQDLLQPLQILFNTPIKNIDTAGFILSDTNYLPVANVPVTLDSTRKIISIKAKWQPETPLILIIPKEGLSDSLDNTLTKPDTIRFTTKSVSDYGTVTLRFKNLQTDKHPVLQFMNQGAVQYSYAVSGSEWTNKMFPPGDYEIRILYDANNNGQWDPGSYKEKRQPEKAVSIQQRLTIKADWENERDVEL